MCKARIEKAAKAVEGVQSADWNKDTKEIKLALASNVDIHKVHMAIANVGHDTEMHKAKDEVYESLEECCHYRDGDGGHSHDDHSGHEH